MPLPKFRDDLNPEDYFPELESQGWNLSKLSDDLVNVITEANSKSNELELNSTEENISIAEKLRAFAKKLRAFLITIPELTKTDFIILRGILAGYDNTDNLLTELCRLSGETIVPQSRDSYINSLNQRFSSHLSIRLKLLYILKEVPYSTTYRNTTTGRPSETKSIDKGDIPRYLEQMGYKENKEKSPPEEGSTPCEENKPKGYDFIFPSGAVPLESLFYIKREPMESECYKSILEPRSVTRIMAPSKFGKTSLLNRIVDHAKRQNYRVAYVNIKQFIDRSTCSSLEAFLRCFCEVVGEKLGLSLDSAWPDYRTAQINCTRHFEKLLKEAETPLLLVLDGVEKLYSHDTINPEFFPMLRSWHDRASDPDKEHWKNLRQVIAYSCQNYGNLDFSRSPFNIGRSFDLEEFTEAEIVETVQKYGLTWNLDQVKQLMLLIGGHPYLVNLALYELAHHSETTLEQFLEDNPSDGIYRDYLRLLIERLDPDLISALNRVINTTEKSVRLDPKLQYKLYSIGVIKYQNFQIKIRCELYRQYFQEYLF